MKKNTMMRLASFLLIAVLITTSAISGTYAKYVTSDSASDTARVAEWGVEVAITGTLFGDKYAKTEAETVGDKITANAEISTVNGAGDKVVAPGTKNLEGMTFKVTGIPEVSGTITATTPDTVKEIFLGKGNWGVLVVAPGVNDASVMADYYIKDGESYKVATNYVAGTTYYEMHDKAVLTDTYYPIVWNDDRSVRLSAFATELTTAMNTTFTPNTDLNNNAARTKNLKWEWPFSTNDEADTILGNLFAANSDAIVVVSADGTTYAAPTVATVAGEGKYCLDVSFGATITVTQVN